MNEFTLGALTVTVVSEDDIRLHVDGRVYATVTVRELGVAARQAYRAVGSRPEGRRFETRVLEAAQRICAIQDVMLFGYLSTFIDEVRSVLLDVAPHSVGARVLLSLESQEED